MNSTFPVFRVGRVVSAESRARLSGAVTATRRGSETWIGDKHWGYLKRGDLLVRGRWHAASDHWEFVLEQGADINLLEGATEVEVLNGYWGERAQLVLATSLSWQSDVWLDEADHDHCAICWATINVFTHREHFRASSGERICACCYGDYVKRRSLAFIEGVAQQAHEADGA
jgi:hypothetical protein